MVSCRRCEGGSARTNGACPLTTAWRTCRVNRRCCAWTGEVASKDVVAQTAANASHEWRLHLGNMGPSPFNFVLFLFRSEGAVEFHSKSQRQRLPSRTSRGTATFKYSNGAYKMNPSAPIMMPGELLLHGGAHIGEARAHFSAGEECRIVDEKTTWIAGRPGARATIEHNESWPGFLKQLRYCDRKLPCQNPIQLRERVPALAESIEISAWTSRTATSLHPFRPFAPPPFQRGPDIFSATLNEQSIAKARFEESWAWNRGKAGYCR
jgi:hypothetical protein